MQKLGVIILLFFLVSGCSVDEEVKIPDHIEKLDNLSVYPADTQPMKEIQLEREQTFGSRDEMLVGGIGDIEVSKRGKVFISDTKQNILHVFLPDGSYIKRIGREGRGPGEFISPPRLLSVTSNQFFLYDAMQNRLNIYSVDSLIFSHAIEPSFNKKNSMKKTTEPLRLSEFYVRDDSTFLVSYGQIRNLSPGQLKNDSYKFFYLMNSEGSIISNNIFKQKVDFIFSAMVNGEFRVAKFPFAGKSLIAVSTKNGHIFTAWSEYFLIKERDPDGNYLRSIYYSFKRQKLTSDNALQAQDAGSEYEKDVLKWVEGIFNRIPKDELPDIWPALHSMLIDDENRLWVSTIVDDMEVYQWWVLDATDGTLLTRFDWPRDKEVETIKNGKLYTRETEQETGLQKIVRYDIKMGEQE